MYPLVWIDHYSNRLRGIPGPNRPEVKNHERLHTLFGLAKANNDRSKVAYQKISENGRTNATENQKGNSRRHRSGNKAGNNGTG